MQLNTVAVLSTGCDMHSACIALCTWDHLDASGYTDADQSRLPSAPPTSLPVLQEAQAQTRTHQDTSTAQNARGGGGKGGGGDGGGGDGGGDGGGGEGGGGEGGGGNGGGGEGGEHIHVTARHSTSQGSADVIRLDAGTYEVSTTLTVDRNVTITADVVGESVVLDGQGARRVMTIDGGTVRLIGLNITRGSADQARVTPPWLASLRG